MHAPIAVDDLGDAKIDGGRHQRDRLVLAEAFDVHQEAPHFPERILHGKVERGLCVDLALALRAELGEIVGMAEPGQHPVGLGLDQGIREIGKGPACKIGLLVQDHLERACHRAFDRGAAELAVALRGMGIADREQRAGHRNRKIDRRALARAANCRDCRRNRTAARS